MDNILDTINEQISNKEFETAKIQLEDLLKEDEHNIEAMKMLGLCNVNLKLNSRKIQKRRCNKLVLFRKLLRQPR